MSRGLDSMLREVWPHQLGQQSVPQICDTIHSPFREIPEEVHLELFEWWFGGFFRLRSASPTSWCSSGIDRSMERPSPRRSLNFSRLVSNKRPDTVDVCRHLQKISLQRQVHQSRRPLHHCGGQPRQSLFQHTWKYLASNPRSRYWESD